MGNFAVARFLCQIPSFWGPRQHFRFCIPLLGSGPTFASWKIATYKTNRKYRSATEQQKNKITFKKVQFIAIIAHIWPSPPPSSNPSKYLFLLNRTEYICIWGNFAQLLQNSRLELHIPFQG